MQLRSLNVLIAAPCSRDLRREIHILHKASVRGFATRRNNYQDNKMKVFLGLYHRHQKMKILDHGVVGCYILIGSFIYLFFYCIVLYTTPERSLQPSRGRRRMGFYSTEIPQHRRTRSQKFPIYSKWRYNK